MRKQHTASAYARTGVRIDVKLKALERARRLIRGTATPGVAGPWGLFGGLFAAPGRDTLLVSSIDGVGTKLKVALRAGRHDTVGQDIVNHCVNDILVQGAEPLFFMDYIGVSRLQPRVFQALVAGLCKACRANGCALLGGETAELPGLYPDGEYDLVGCIVGAVRRRDLVTGRAIRPSDVLIGLPSTGLHTNGYSLARRILFETAKLSVNDLLPGTRRKVSDVLLAVHRSYLHAFRALRGRVRIHGMAHITGGGFPDNLPRVLPPGLCAVVDGTAWQPPPLFRFLQQAGGIARKEMYRVFNMGIGMVFFVPEDHAVEALEVLREAGERPVALGWVERGAPPVKMYYP